MKTQTLKIAAVFGLMIISTLLFAQSSVTINSVDNYGGNSNVYTDAPNTEVTITELDADKRPVRSWTGKTDDKGKITIPAGHNLSQPYLKVAIANGKMPNYVVPPMLEQGTPFSFSAVGMVEGEVVSIQDESGEVVARPKTDNKGRVFMATGLGIGLYNLVCGNGKSQRVGQIQVKPRLNDALLRPGMTEIVPLTLHSCQPILKAGDMVNLSGRGINPNAASLEGMLGGAKMNALAATPHCAILEAPKSAGLSAGKNGSLQLRDRESGQMAKAGDVFVYDAWSRLVRKVVPSGAATQLEVQVMPSDWNGDVVANIVTGPVKFENGKSEMSAALVDGKAIFPIRSEPGRVGNFQLQWIVQPISHSNSLTNGISVPIMNAIEIKPAGSRKRGHTIGGGASNPDGWTDEYIDYDNDGNRIGRTTETYDKNGRLRERKTTRDGAKDGDRTVKTETYDADGKWAGTKTETFEGGKQTGGTQTEPDGKGGETTKTWDKETGQYK